MATPMVAGVCALIWSQNPSWTNTQVETQLYASAEDIESELSSTYRGKMGAGRINAYDAVNTGTPDPPVAEFSGTPTSGEEPLTVSFSDLSTGSITSWSWTFGDGGTSTAQNPSHEYTSDGTYSVSLTVTGPGGSDGETKNGYITVDPCTMPTAGFTGSPTSGEVPLDVNFSNSSSDATSYSWTFGDGGTSTATNPSHTYTSAGTYTVALTATNSCGNDVHTMTDYITVTCTAPTAGFTGTPTSGDYPLDVTFTDASTGATSYSWNFGDGGTSTSANPTYTYTAAGTFTVTQTVTNSCGNDELIRTDYITVTESPCYAPVADFSGSPTSGDYNLLVSFTDLSTNTPTSWNWTFGDGGTSTAQNPSYTYTAAGTYAVSLTATNSCGSDSETKTGYITVTEPTGGFCDDFGDGDISDWNIISGDWTVSGGQLDGYIASGTAFIMSPVGTVSDATTITVDWTSLTGGTWTNGIVVFGYIDANNYRVADFRDGANKWYIREFVGGSQSNVATLSETINTNQLYAMEVIIDASGLVTVKADGVTKVSYNFGNVQSGLIGLEVNQSHSQFDNFCVDADTPPPPAPTAAFAGTPTSGVFPLDVDFTDQSTDSPTSWSWNFGDGGNSTAQNPSYTYTAAGTYTVTLTATNTYGSDDEVKTNYITVTSPPAPTAEFNGTPTTGDYPLLVTFTDESTDSPTSWDWTFGDGGTSTAQNPSYTYSAAGTYTVTLTATNAYGNDTETKTGYIVVTEPGVGGWTTITYDDFEAGIGSYTDGGGDCKLYSGSYSHQGSYSMEIRDNSGTASSFYHTGSYNVAGYTELEVEFWFKAVSMDNTKEDFWLQYYDGSTWQTVETWARTTDFDNNVFYNKVVSIPSGTYNYPSNAQIRFMCDASGNRDYVYIDEVEFRGFSTTSALSGNNVAVLPNGFSLEQNYPNPFNPSTTFEFSIPITTQVTLNIYNMLGQKVATPIDRVMEAGIHSTVWDARDVASGVYFYRLNAGEFTAQKKMLLLK